MAVQKWKSFDFGSETNTRKRAKNGKPKDIEMRNIHDILTPKSVEDLAVHAKKIEQLDTWLKTNTLCEVASCPFLLISGPSGSGKTTAVNALCNKLNISISEWINPSDQFDSNQLSKFTEFLLDSKWNSLYDTGNSRKINLVEDFPNAILESAEQFSNTLSECSTLKCPVVFVCSTNAKNYKTFTDDIMSKYNITNISFNACAPSLMKKAIARAQSILKDNFDLYTRPTQSTIDDIVEQAGGDIRNAMNQLYFACIGIRNVYVTVDNKRKRVKKSEPLRMARDEPLGLFHGLGRVLNPKRKTVNNSWRINCDIDTLVEEFLIQPSMFVSFLFENYLNYFGHISDVYKAAQVLSFSVHYTSNWFEKQDTVVYGLWVSILGMIIYNEHKVSKWNQIRGLSRSNWCTGNVDTKQEHSTDRFYRSIIKNDITLHKFL